MSDDESDCPELRELAKLDELKEKYGSAMSQAAYNKRLKAIMIKYTYNRGAGDQDGGAASGSVAPRGKYLWGKEADSYEKVSKAKEFKTFTEAKEMLKDIEDKEWKRDPTAPGNQEWRRFVIMIGKVETIAKISKEGKDKFKCQVGKMQLNIHDEEDVADEEPEEKVNPTSEEVKAQVDTSAGSPSRPLRETRKPKEMPEVPKVPASGGKKRKHGK